MSKRADDVLFTMFNKITMSKAGEYQMSKNINSKSKTSLLPLTSLGVILLGISSMREQRYIDSSESGSIPESPNFIEGRKFGDRLLSWGKQGFASEFTPTLWGCRVIACKHEG